MIHGAAHPDLPTGGNSGCFRFSKSMVRRRPRACNRVLPPERGPPDWQQLCSWVSRHTGFGGGTPMERCCELFWHTPFREDVIDTYIPAEEPVQDCDHTRDLEVLRL